MYIVLQMLCIFVLQRHVSVPKIDPGRFILAGSRKRYFKPEAVNIDFSRKYYENTFISATRAMSDYLLKPRYLVSIIIYTTHNNYNRPLAGIHFIIFLCEKG